MFILGLGIGPYFKAELLTLKYGHDINNELNKLEAYGWEDHDFYRIIDIDIINQTFKVYYEVNDNVGLSQSIKYAKNKYTLTDSELIWTRYGNGEDKLIYPFYSFRFCIS